MLTGREVVIEVTADDYWKGAATPKLFGQMEQQKCTAQILVL